MEFEQEKRRQLYRELQRIVAVDLPYLNLWYSDNICVHRRRITNVQLTPAGDYDFVGQIVVR